MGNLKVIHLFSGVGAPEMALKKLGVPIEIVGFSEIDKYAIKSYKAIHGEDKQNLGDIKEIERLPQCNLLVYGSPCQDFSIAGLQKGLVDKEGNQTRSGLLFEVERLLEVAKQNNELPEVLLMENVKNLVSKKFKPDFDRWLNKLDELGYNCYWQVLNAKDYGIPQNRERVFVVSVRKDVDEGYNFPEKMPLTIRLKDVLEEVVDDKYYLSDKMIDYISKCGTLNYSNHNARINLDIARPLTTAQNKRAGTTNYICDELPKNYDLSNLTAKRLGGLFDEKNSKHQADSIWDKEQLSPTLDTMQGGYRQPLIIDDIKIRKLTPKECWRLMGFSDQDFELARATAISDTQLYKQAGNSIVVDVLYYIFKGLFK